MRKVIGPAILLVLAGISLLFLPHRGPASPANEVATPAAAAAAPTPSTTLTPTSAPSASTSAAAATSSGSGANPEPDGTPVPSSAKAQPRDQSQAARFDRAAQAAAAFIKAFARPSSGLSDVAWWANVKPYLSAAAATDYEGTDPAAVPFTHLTGPAFVLPMDAPADMLTAVRVPTDAGDYTVELQTTPTGMEVTRVVPPTPGGAP